MAINENITSSNVRPKLKLNVNMSNINLIIEPLFFIRPKIGLNLKKCR